MGKLFLANPSDRAYTTIAITGDRAMLGSNPSAVMVPIRQKRRLTVAASLYSLPDGHKAINPSREAADKTPSFVALQIKMRPYNYRRQIDRPIDKPSSLGIRPPLTYIGRQV